MEKNVSVRTESENLNIVKGRSKIRVPVDNTDKENVENIKTLEPLTIDPIKITLFEKTWFLLNEKKRNIGAVLLGTAQILRENNVSGIALSALQYSGWVFIVTGVIHALVKTYNEKQKEGEDDLTGVMLLIKQLVDKIKKLFSNLAKRKEG